jgi:hypothetical protein
MKTWSPEHVRLAQVAVDTRDTLRRLAARIGAAGQDQQLRAEALAAAHQVALTYAELLRGALKDSRARRHRPRTSPEAQTPWGLKGEMQ